jgi:hypothetical protein
VSETERRTAKSVWEEIVRTAALIRAYDPALDEVRGRILHDALTPADAKFLSEIVSDALILVSLIEQLEHRRALAFE